MFICTSDETINKDATLQSYLIVNDVENEPIKPSFYAFGSGEFQVQVKSYSRKSWKMTLIIIRLLILK